MKILLIEDNENIIKGLEYSLSENGFEVTSKITAEEGKKEVIKKIYDLVLLDISLPDSNGFSVCEYIKRNTDTPVIFLTARDEESNVVLGLDLGADDYITKPFNPMELIARVNSQIRRYTTLGSMKKSDDEKNTYQTGELFINDNTKQVIVDGKEIKLTPTEYNILKFLTRNKGNVYSIEQIYENVWEEESYGAENIIAVHIRHIREKIEINPREPKYLKVIWGVGYKIEKM